MMAEPKPLTGKKVLLIAVAAFGVILAANLAMLFAATGTFPGLVVKNSYVASQGWDRKTAAQRALGWEAAAEYSAGDQGGALQVIMTGQDGAPVRGLDVAVVVGKVTSAREDTRLELTEGPGGYGAPLTLAPGRWRIDITGTDGLGNSFEATAHLQVKEPG
jgi:nitrogen fixation protein FixH